MHLVADAHAPAVEAARQPAGVQHAGLDGGGDAFPLARAEQHHVRRQLAQVGQHLVGPLGEVDHQRQRQPQRHAQQLLGDPGQRRVRQVLHAGLDGQRAAHAGGVVDQPAVADHHALGLAGRARGVGQQRQVVQAAGLDLALEALRVAAVFLAARRQQGVEGVQQVVAVRPHARVVPVADAEDVRQPGRHRQRLVDLFLVLGEDELGARVRAQVVQFLGGGVGIDRHRLGAQRLGREDGPVVLGLVFADHDRGVAAGQAQRGGAQRDAAHLL
jgi:hypothetical protein